MLCWALQSKANLHCLSDFGTVPGGPRDWIMSWPAVNTDSAVVHLINGHQLAHVSHYGTCIGNSVHVNKEDARKKRLPSSLSLNLAPAVLRICLGACSVSTVQACDDNTHCTKLATRITCKLGWVSI